MGLPYYNQIAGKALEARVNQLEQAGPAAPTKAYVDAQDRAIAAEAKGYADTADQVIKAYADGKDADNKVTPLTSLIGLTPSAEVRGFRIGTTDSGTVYKIRETARAEELPDELKVSTTWTQWCSTLQNLINQYADQFRGRTYQGNIVIISGFPGQGSNPTTLAVSSQIINDYAAKLDIYSTTIQPYHWQMYSKIGATPNTTPVAVITCEDTDDERAKHYTKEMVFKVNGDNTVQQLWQPALIHDGGYKAILTVTNDAEILTGTLVFNGYVYGICFGTSPYLPTGQAATFYWGWQSTGHPYSATAIYNYSQPTIIGNQVQVKVGHDATTHTYTISFYEMGTLTPGLAFLCLHQTRNV